MHKLCVHPTIWLGLQQTMNILIWWPRNDTITKQTHSSFSSWNLRSKIIIILSYSKEVLGHCLLPPTLGNGGQTLGPFFHLQRSPAVLLLSLCHDDLISYSDLTSISFVILSLPLEQPILNSDIRLTLLVKVRATKCQVAFLLLSWRKKTQPPHCLPSFRMECAL